MANATPQPSLLSASMTIGGGVAATEAASSAISTPSSTPSSSGDSGSDSTDYFFGFIVAFVVLLLLFISCGFGSRRRSVLLGPLWARNIDVDQEGADDDGGGGRFFGGNRAGRGQAKPGQQTVPVFRETWLLPRPDEPVPSRWKDLQPISATFVRPKPLSNQSKVPSTSPPLPAAPNPHVAAALQPRPSIFHLMRTWICSRHSRPHQPEPPPPPSLPTPNAITIAIMVSMPSPFTSKQYVQDKGEGSSTLIYPTLGESISGGCEIGLIQLPWASGEVK
ncbi:hypothetical protein EDD17DRAFT_1869104 [Pisolithus thermaeus]|nr:hypothetical protein EV401DRAFT_991068 [Pisolithus croceorrhizus]KAI6168342.1 hypothetical protein EDD17DRAFT_1869104 [Pisolithus thermaeus]